MWLEFIRWVPHLRKRQRRKSLNSITRRRNHSRHQLPKKSIMKRRVSRFILRQPWWGECVQDYHGGHHWMTSTMLSWNHVQGKGGKGQLKTSVKITTLTGQSRWTKGADVSCARWTTPTPCARNVTLDFALLKSATASSLTTCYVTFSKLDSHCYWSADECIDSDQLSLVIENASNLTLKQIFPF